MARIFDGINIRCRGFTMVKMFDGEYVRSRGCSNAKMFGGWGVLLDDEKNNVQTTALRRSNFKLVSISSVIGKYSSFKPTYK